MCVIVLVSALFVSLFLLYVNACADQDCCLMSIYTGFAAQDDMVLSCFPTALQLASVAAPQFSSSIPHSLISAPGCMFMADGTCWLTDYL